MMWLLLAPWFAWRRRVRRKRQEAARKASMDVWFR
jgi:hypothetical protein